MTPHEVVKDSLEKFEERFKDSFSGGDMNEWERAGPIIEHLKSSHLSLLLSVKEMVEQQKNNPQEISNMLAGSENNKFVAFKFIGANEMIDNLQSFLDTEINKIKEL